MEPILFVSFAVSFLTTYLLVPVWIRAARKAGLTGKDMNKADHPEVAEMGGIAVTAGFIGGVMTYIALTTRSPS